MRKRTIKTPPKPRPQPRKELINMTAEEGRQAAREIVAASESFGEVLASEYGCKNCLWAGCECKAGSKYEPHTAHDGTPSCKGYSYHD